MFENQQKKSARFAGTFLSRAARSGIFERRASRSVLVLFTYIQVYLL